MGLMTLADFRDELTEVLGNRGIPAPRMNRWINFAKNEVESAVDLETSKVCRYFDTVVGQYRYQLAPGFLSVVSIQDETSDYSLVRTDSENLEMRQTPPDGSPKFWARRGRELIISPAPDGIYRIMATLVLETPGLELDGDTTVHPAYWDNAIHLASVSYAYNALNEEQRGAIWHQRFVAYMQSRMMDYDFEGQTHSEPVRVVTDFRDLRRR